MRAVVYSDYGGPYVLRHLEIEKPAAADNEILVKVHAASVNPADWHMMRGTPYLIRMGRGFRKPASAQRVGLDYAARSKPSVAASRNTASATRYSADDRGPSPSI
jgi:NADPH:quinone reductase-like Zn-dependent oxidoreductase